MDDLVSFLFLGLLFSINFESSTLSSSSSFPEIKDRAALLAEKKKKSELWKCLAAVSVHPLHATPSSFGPPWVFSRVYLFFFLCFFLRSEGELAGRLFLLHPFE